MLQNLLYAFGSKYCEKPLYLNDEGYCVLKANIENATDEDLIFIETAPKNDGWFFYGVVTYLAAKEKAQILQTAMEMNLFGQRTLGATLGYDPATEVLLLHLYCPNSHYTEGDADEFHAMLKSFSLALDRCKKEIAQALTPPDHQLKGVASGESSLIIVRS